jgi:hypothetical protein
MQKDYGRIWIEKMFKSIPVPYPIVSLIIAGIVYSIFLFFSTRVVFFIWEFYHQLVALDLSILIALQLAGIQYLLNQMKKNFKELKSYPESTEILYNLYLELERRFTGSLWYYVMVLIVIVPFVIIELINILKGGVTFYIVERTIWSFLLDIYNNVIGYFMLFLLAIILWLINNIAWTLNKIGSPSYIRLIKIDIFSIDKIGGLKPLRDFILKVLVFYFICITLAIISYVSPFSIFSYESFFFIILLLVGIVFFLLGLQTIQKIFRGRVEEELDKINEKYQQEHQRLMSFVSEGNYKDKVEELNLVSTTLETLYTERERILKLHASSKGYDLMTIIEFVSSFILPLGAFLQKIMNIGFEIKKFL